MTDDIIISEQSGIRYLHFGSEWVQGAMQIRKRDLLVLAYAREMQAFLLFRPPPKTILNVGLGCGSLVRYALKHYPDAQITSVEINPAVVALSRSSFPLPQNEPRSTIVLADACEHIASVAPGSVDLLWSDGYTAKGRVSALETVDYFENVKRALSPFGVIAANCFGASRRARETLTAFRTVFGEHVMTLTSDESKNMIVIAGTNPLVADAAHAALLEAQYGFPFTAWLARMLAAKAKLGKKKIAP